MFRETYDVGQVDLSAGASIRVFSHLTESIQKEIEEKIAKDPEISRTSRIWRLERPDD